MDRSGVEAKSVMLLNLRTPMHNGEESSGGRLLERKDRSDVEGFEGFWNLGCSNIKEADIDGRIKGWY